jgi:hypothetical protein
VVLRSELGSDPGFGALLQRIISSCSMRSTGIRCRSTSWSSCARAQPAAPSGVQILLVLQNNLLDVATFPACGPCFGRTAASPSSISRSRSSER